MGPIGGALGASLSVALARKDIFGFQTPKDESDFWRSFAA